MTTSFARLCDAVPPPIAPVEAGSTEAFGAVEARLALALPHQYKQMICAYGTGSWKAFLWVLNPFAANTFLNLFDQADRQLDAERLIRQDLPSRVPFALYPESGGLLPWAMTDNGDRLYWLTAGNPDEWPTIIYESRGPMYDRLEMSCCELLLRWVGGALKVAVFPEDVEYGFVNAFKRIEPTTHGLYKRE